MIAGLGISLMSAGLLASGNVCTQVTLIGGHNGEVIVGAEDIVIDEKAGRAYISAYDRRATAEMLDQETVPTTAGGIYALDLRVFNNTTPDTVVVSDLTAAYKESTQFRPHGIDIYFDNGSAKTLYAVNRVYRDGVDGIELKPQIDSFNISADGLEYRNTVQDDLLCSPNDVAAISADRFFATNDHGACDGFDRLAEDVLGLYDSYVVYFDGTRSYQAADEIGFSNGISYRDGDLYVAATRQDAVQIYQTTDYLADPATKMTLARSIPLDASPDNLSWDRDGYLLVGAIPGLLRLALYQSGYAETSPSLILRLDPDQPDTMLKIFEDPGGLLSAATVAVQYNNFLFIGTVQDDHIVVCRFSP